MPSRKMSVAANGLFEVSVLIRMRRGAPAHQSQPTQRVALFRDIAAICGILAELSRARDEEDASGLVHPSSDDPRRPWGSQEVACPGRIMCIRNSDIFGLGAACAVSCPYPVSPKADSSLNIGIVSPKAAEVQLTPEDRRVANASSFASFWKV
jgi:hypothetical protein